MSIFSFSRNHYCTLGLVVLFTHASASIHRGRRIGNVDATERGDSVESGPSRYCIPGSKTRFHF